MWNGSNNKTHTSLQFHPEKCSQVSVIVSFTMHWNHLHSFQPNTWRWSHQTADEEKSFKFITLTFPAPKLGLSDVHHLLDTVVLYKSSHGYQHNHSKDVSHVFSRISKDISNFIHLHQLYDLRQNVEEYHLSFLIGVQQKLNTFFPYFIERL